jgi:hypothetical protein
LEALEKKGFSFIFVQRARGERVCAGGNGGEAAEARGRAVDRCGEGCGWMYNEEK